MYHQTHIYFAVTDVWVISKYELVEIMLLWVFLNKSLGAMCMHFCWVHTQERNFWVFIGNAFSHVVPIERKNVEQLIACLPTSASQETNLRTMYLRNEFESNLLKKQNFILWTYIFPLKFITIKEKLL